jgi:hypothetical protein
MTDSQQLPERRVVLTAGLTLLFSMLLSSFANFGVLQGLVVPGDAGTTVANVSASEGLFRLATAAFLAVAVLDVLAAAALYVLLRPTNSRLAVLMAGARVAAAAVFVVGVTSLLDLAPTHVMASLASFDRVWAISLAFFGLHLLVLGVLLLRSAGFPRLLGVLVIVAGGGYLADSLVATLAPDLAFTPSALTFFGQAFLIFWLLRRAIRPDGRATEPDVATPIPSSYLPAEEHR